MNVVDSFFGVCKLPESAKTAKKQKMAQKRTGRGRPRRSPRTATGFPANRRKTRRNQAPSSSEPTSAFEALMQVTSAEYERLNSNNNSDNRSDSSSKSTEENRNMYAPLSSPSNVTLPAWYGAPNVTPKPFKSELILPPKKKKYLHYLAEADDDNKIINDPFHQPEQNAAVNWAGTSGSPETPQNETGGSMNISSIVPESLPSSSSNRLSEESGELEELERLSPLKFNPTPVAPSSSRTQDGGKTFSDVLDEHISRLIVQNDHIVSKQPVVVMNKRGRSRDSKATEYGEFSRGESVCQSGTSNESCMVKNLLSSKLTRKTLAKEIAEQRPPITPTSSSFSYLNPENSAIKDLLIKTYEEKGMGGSCALLTQQDYSRFTREFKSPGNVNGYPRMPPGCVFRISSDTKSGALVVPDCRSNGGSAENSIQPTGWTILSGNEWVFFDERGRRRVRPEKTIVPETAAYQAVTPSPVRSPSADSVMSFESVPSSASHYDALTG